MLVNLAKNSRQNICCDFCNYECSKQSDYDKHLMTRKHKMLVNASKMLVENSPSKFVCECGKHYKHDTSYYRHKKSCSKLTHNSLPSEYETMHSSRNATQEVIYKVIDKKDKQIEQLIGIITDLKDGMVEIANAPRHNTINNSNNTTNSHNKTFNLNFFLNETCKDAMNITDFVNSLKLTLQDLEKVGELGYAEGISRMFVQGLNELEVTKRPIHCSDLKREIIHIKDKDGWEKDTRNQDRLKKAIKDVSNKNIMLLDDWQRVNPGCTEYDHRKNDIYLRMVVEAMGPADETTEKKDFGKIIRTIAKSTIIDKTAIA